MGNTNNKFPKRDVDSSHKAVASGVRFNVEKTSDIGEPLAKRDLVAEMSVRPQSRYAKKQYLFAAYPEEKFLSLKIEATSLGAAKNVVDYGCFFQAAYYAFARHYPLIIRPGIASPCLLYSFLDDIWILLASAFAKHVDLNAERFRSKFVKHQGKKLLAVQVDDFVLGQTPYEQWERDVFPDFSRQIKQHIPEHIHSTVAKGFSTSQPTDVASFEITLMASMKSYFSYAMTTCSGIPWIELQGTLQDWIDLRERAEKLLTGIFEDKYVRNLMPVLDQFVEAYKGNVDELFWQSMIKRIEHGQGSGSYSTVSGWINLLFPYLGENRNLNKPWEKLLSDSGHRPSAYPDVVASSCPVLWNYLGEDRNLHFHAGMFGVTQDPETRALACTIGWVVTHDPPKDKATRLPLLEKLYAINEKSSQCDLLFMDALRTEIETLQGTL